MGALLEYTKCMQNTPYALRTYLQTYDNTQSRYVPLELFPDQVRLVEDYDSFNENIISWGSEEFWIPYVSPVDNRVHRYFPDFIIKVKEQTGEIKTYVIEVKPKKQTVPPKQKSRVTKSFLHEAKTYAVNQAKWKAAQEWCADRMLEFKVITEEELGIK